MIFRCLWFIKEDKSLRIWASSNILVAFKVIAQTNVFYTMKCMKGTINWLNRIVLIKNFYNLPGMLDCTSNYNQMPNFTKSSVVKTFLTKNVLIEPVAWFFLLQLQIKIVLFHCISSSSFHIKLRKTNCLNIWMKTIVWIVCLPLQNMNFYVLILHLVYSP